MSSELAINGGKPVRDTLLPYGKQSIDQKDIDAVITTLSSDWLTTGPKISEFEKAFALSVGTAQAVAVSNGTAALHAMMIALDIKKEDEVIVPAMTFAATANAVVFQGGTPVFADSDPKTLLIDPRSVESLVTDKTKAIIAVDYAGQPCDYKALRTIADAHGIALVADACHAIGATLNGKPVGSLADMSSFSFHPVKPMTTGEGGMISTDNAEFATKMRQFRNHGINSDHRQRQEQGSWFYEMQSLGFNYRLTDIQCALGITQLPHISEWTMRRQEIAKIYDEAFASVDGVTPLRTREDTTNAYHLYVIKVRSKREEVFAALRAEHIGVNVHYIPVHLHPFYRENFGTQKGQCPNTETAYDQILSLPMFARMTDDDTRDVIVAVQKVTTALDI